MENMRFFKIGLILAQKWKHMNQMSIVYPYILGGVLRGFWSLFLERGARSAIFWYLKTGTFGN